VKLGTVIVSTALHVGLAAGLITVAERKGLGKKTISVAVTGEKKKQDKPKPPPPKPIAKPVTKLAALPKARPRWLPRPRRPHAPVVTNLAMSNADLDVGPGIGLHGRAGPAAAVAPTKVASAISEARTRRTREGPGGWTRRPLRGGAHEARAPRQDAHRLHDLSAGPGRRHRGEVQGARIIVAANGEVSDVEILVHIDPGFDAAIEAALRRWRFKPAMACGKPVAGGSLPFTAKFELGD
jgi:outer membrane biosynthesis protein TonB